jgi:SLT domain-containing protein
MDAILTGSYGADNTASAEDTTTNTSTTVLNDQLIAQFIEQINQNRHSEEAIAQLLQDENFINSLQQIDKVRDFIGDL